MTEYLYVADPPEADASGVWLTDEASEHLPSDVIANAARVECVADVDAHHGHYMVAWWLLAVAPLLDMRTRAARAYQRPKFARDVRELRSDARREAREYLATRSPHGRRPRPPRWWAPDVDGDYEATLPEAIHHLADDVEDLLRDLGYITEWRDSGVATWRIVGC